MGNFDILPHTADVGFRATGSSLADLFQTAAVAMFSVEYDLSGVSFEEEAVLECQGEDLEATLYAWLSELLWLHDAEAFVPGEVMVDEVVEEAEGWRVRGAIRGRRLSDWFVQLGPQLKAVTMHELAVRQVGEAFEATVYLDV
ncbi:MAG: archease [Actinomycetota bacterium]